jgi:hypothetical protein
LPVNSISSRPPANDLVCGAEPDATAAALDPDKFGLQHDKDVLIWGRGCHDALRRVCQWHIDKGAKELVCDPI